MHGEQDRVGVGGSLSGRAGECAWSGFAGQPLEFLLVARVAEHDVVSGPRQDRPELAPHQAGAQYADAHRRSPVFCDLDDGVQYHSSNTREDTSVGSGEPTGLRQYRLGVWSRLYGSQSEGHRSIRTEHAIAGRSPSSMSSESAYSMCKTLRARVVPAWDDACRISGRMATTPPAATRQSNSRCLLEDTG